MKAALLLAAALLVHAAGPYAGSVVCSECHRAEAAHYGQTPMAMALESVTTCDILRKHPELKGKFGDFEYRISRQGDSSILTVTGKGKDLTVPLLWAFGLGKAGQTYVFERAGVFYESRVSYYEALDGLDYTMGAGNTRVTDIEDAAGRPMSVEASRDCFGCHSTGGVTLGRLHLDAMRPGVGCEACHGPSGQHVTAVRAGHAAEAKMARLGGLSAEEMSELCGRCHRTWSQIATQGPLGVNNVRFQPYRLANSKCYDATDARMRCTACHDPHGPLVRSAAAYDAKCVACHSAGAGGKLCSVARATCTGCHMPKLDLPGANAKFTDHQIRIVRANQPYPN